MDFSKLDQNEKLAVYGSAAVVIAGLISTYGGLMWLAILAAIGMLVVVFLPQFSAGTTLPGSKGTLMATLGFVAAASALITLLQWMSVIGILFGSLATIMLIVAIVGAAVMAWAGWQELQAEGGKWQFGSETSTGTTTTAATTAPRTSDPAPAATAPGGTTATTTDSSVESASAAAPPTATTAAPPPASPMADPDPVPPATSSFDEDYGTDPERRDEA